MRGTVVRLTVNRSTGDERQAEYFLHLLDGLRTEVCVTQKELLADLAAIPQKLRLRYTDQADALQFELDEIDRLTASLENYLSPD